MLEYLLKEVSLGDRVNDKSTNDDNQQSILHIAAAKGNERIIFMLAGNEGGYFAKVSATDANGNTPLHIAAMDKNPSAARFLLSMKAEVDVQNKDGNTPLHLSVKSENLRTAKDLLLKGAERKIKNHQSEIAADFVNMIEDGPTKSSFKSALVRNHPSYINIYIICLEIPLVLWMPSRQTASDASEEKRPFFGPLCSPLLLHLARPSSSHSAW